MKIRARIAVYSSLALAVALTWLVHYQGSVIELQRWVIWLLQRKP